jgi:hypothetical protein
LWAPEIGSPCSTVLFESLGTSAGTRSPVEGVEGDKNIENGAGEIDIEVPHADANQPPAASVQAASLAPPAFECCEFSMTGRRLAATGLPAAGATGTNQRLTWSRLDSEPYRLARGGKSSRAENPLQRLTANASHMVVFAGRKLWR